MRKIDPKIIVGVVGFVVIVGTFVIAEYSAMPKYQAVRECVVVEVVSVWTQRDHDASPTLHTLFPHMIVRTTEGRLFRVMGQCA